MWTNLLLRNLLLRAFVRPRLPAQPAASYCCAMLRLRTRLHPPMHPPPFTNCTWCM